MRKFYFPHDENAASDERLIKLRTQFGNAEGYGMWWMVLEHLVRNQGYLEGDGIGVLSLSYGLEGKKVAQFIAFCVDIGLLEKDARGLFNDRLMDHINLMERKVEGGKKGAKKRWGSQQSGIRTPISTPNAKAYAEERRGEESKEKKEKSLKKTDEKTDPVIEKPKLADDEVIIQFFDMAMMEGWTDKNYVEAKTTQLETLDGEHRANILRKMRVALNANKSAGEKTKALAKKMYFETVGLINDKALDKATVSNKELAKRNEFAEDSKQPEWE